MSSQQQQMLYKDIYAMENYSMNDRKEKQLLEAFNTSTAFLLEGSHIFTV